jgi:hypothetical protein
MLCARSTPLSVFLLRRATVVLVVPADNRHGKRRSRPLHLSRAAEEVATTATNSPFGLFQGARTDCAGSLTTTASYGYDYADQDPVNSHDFTGLADEPGAGSFGCCPVGANGPATPGLGDGGGAPSADDPPAGTALRFSPHALDDLDKPALADKGVNEKWVRATVRTGIRYVDPKFGNDVYVRQTARGRYIYVSVRNGVVEHVGRYTKLPNRLILKG